MAACSLVPEAELVGRLPENALALVLDGVSDPRNVGAVARSGAAMGAHGLFLPGWRSAGLSPGAARTAAGALETLPVSRAGNSGRLLDALAERGLALIALDANSGLPPWDVDLAGGLALVAGGEEKGLRRSLMERADAVVRIPVREEVGSLNVSVAVGMVLLECARQRSCATGAENPEGGS
jgi:23S rRNA (guanosine2251-2'-O)-methyltransferase